MRSLQLNRVNRLYAENSGRHSLDFIDAILENLGVKHDISDVEIGNIPLSGPFITVSNHPLGGIDGLLLLKIIASRRSDFKVFGNFLLQRIKPISNHILPVNPFDKKQSMKSSVTGLMQARRHLEAGHGLGIFPAGEVSSINDRSVQDRQWTNAAIKFIRNTGVPVVPVYFHGQNSNLFYLLGLINPMLRTVKLPSELFNKRNKTVGIRIGHVIDPADQSEFGDLSELGRYLRTRTYSLGSSIEVKNFYLRKLKRADKADTIGGPFDINGIEDELTSLPRESTLLKAGSFTLYVASANQIPLTLNEIGRLREVTFRAVGEGTNRSIDLDEYDLYYEHLFIWDRDKKAIAGAYRFARGGEIARCFGKKGFYINSLFSIDRQFLPVLSKSIELGRSFVAPEYQKRSSCLFLLWKGILCVLLRHSEYRYLIGPVSISNSYSRFSKSLIIDFIRAKYYDHHYSAFIRPRKKFKVSYRKVDAEVMLRHTNGDIEKLDRLIGEIEPGHCKMPMLVKKYLKQNARILGFNVDPRFNKALDGLMILDLCDVPAETLRSLSKEMNDAGILERFYTRQAVDEFSNAPQL